MTIDSSTPLNCNGNVIVNFSTGLTSQVIDGSATVDNTAVIVYFDPASVVTSATITLPATPFDRQPVEIHFGGIITSGVVATTITYLPNTGQSLIGVLTPFISPVAGSTVIFRYREDTSTWYLTF